MTKHKIKYLLIILLFVIGCSSERNKIESKTYSFSTSFPTTLLLRTLERVNVKFEVSWNICKPKLFWNVYEKFNEGTIKNDIYIILSSKSRYESSLHQNNDFLSKQSSSINKIKENVELIVNESGICIKTLQITKA